MKLFMSNTNNNIEAIQKNSAPGFIETSNKPRHYQRCFSELFSYINQFNPFNQVTCWSDYKFGNNNSFGITIKGGGLAKIPANYWYMVMFLTEGYACIIYTYGINSTSYLQHMVASISGRHDEFLEGCLPEVNKKL